MGADAYSGYFLLLQVEVEGADGLVQRGLGGAIRQPPAEVVVGDGAHPGRHVDPLRELLRGGVAGCGRWEESREMFHEEEVGDDVELEGVLNRLAVQICRLTLWVQHAAAEEGGVEVRLRVFGVCFGELFGRRGHCCFGGQVQVQQFEPVRVDVFQRREDVPVYVLRIGRAVGRDDREVCCA